MPTIPRGVRTGRAFGTTHCPVGNGPLVGSTLAIVYKAAAEIGELGDNTRALREAIQTDARSVAPSLTTAPR